MNQFVACVFSRVWADLRGPLPAVALVVRRPADVGVSGDLFGPSSSLGLPSVFAAVAAGAVGEAAINVTGTVGALEEALSIATGTSSPVDRKTEARLHCDILCQQFENP